MKQNLKKGIKYEENFECETIEALAVENGENPVEQRISDSGISNANINDDEKRQIFDTVYDDIYEVVLPNTLWGIHRSEERRYIAFTLFNANEMKCTIAVKITDNFNLKVFINGEQQTDEALDELSVDTLTKLLAQLNENADLQKTKCP